MARQILQNAIVFGLITIIALSIYSVKPEKNKSRNADDALRLLKFKSEEYLGFLNQDRENFIMN